MGMTERVGSRQMHLDPESGAGYLRLTGEKVAYSIDLDDEVIADYDKEGQVVGVEFLAGNSLDVEIERYIELAKVRSKGIAAGTPPRIPI